MASPEIRFYYGHVQATRSVVGICKDDVSHTDLDSAPDKGPRAAECACNSIMWHQNMPLKGGQQDAE